MIFLLLLLVVVVVDDEAVTAIDPDPLLHIIMIINHNNIICFIIVMTDYRNTIFCSLWCWVWMGWCNVSNATNQINTTIPHTGHINVVVCCHNQEDTDIPYFVPRGWTDGPTANHGNRIYRSRTNGSTENVSPMKMSNDLLPVVIKFLYWPSMSLGKRGASYTSTKSTSPRDAFSVLLIVTLGSLWQYQMTTRSVLHESLDCLT